MDKTLRQEVLEILDTHYLGTAVGDPGIRNDSYTRILSLLRTKVMEAIPSEKDVLAIKKSPCLNDLPFNERDARIRDAEGHNSAISTMKENVERLFE